MGKFLFFFWIITMVVVVASVQQTIKETNAKFEDAFKFMEQIQSQSIMVWELTEGEFELLETAYQLSISHIYDESGHTISPDGLSIEENTNPKCRRCLLYEDVLAYGLTEAELSTFKRMARSTPEAFERQLSDMLSKIGVNGKTKTTVANKLREINHITFQSRKFVRYIRWFYEYQKSRDPGDVEVIEVPEFNE